MPDDTLALFMAIIGLHGILYSPHADRLRDALGGALGFRNVDAGGGWPIFAMPPAELAVHPGEDAHHEIYFMCDDAEATRAALMSAGLEVSDISDQRWGRLMQVTLAPGETLGIYQPLHAAAVSRVAVIAFFTALERGDYDAARALLGEPFDFSAWFGAYTRPDDYIDALKKLRGFVAKVDVHRMFDAGRDVCVLYDSHTIRGQQTLVAAWFRVTDGRITRVRIICDPEPFRELWRPVA
jgi:ketosteroid isomerase-like protein